MPATKTKAWISALRLRTLPLALASIGMGSFLAAYVGRFDWLIFILASLTTLFLQVLSNLANDYGDTQHGADSADRIGPMRAVQSGAISPTAMKQAIIITGALSLISGFVLIGFGLQGLSIQFWIGFFVLGLTAIAAAIKYTAGDHPYGYKGLGDLFVFIFFGIAGVAGSFFLHTHVFSWWILLPSASMGLLSMGVLNMNNMRDHISDKKAGKITMVVRMGFDKAKWYQVGLISLAIISAAIFVFKAQMDWKGWLFLITLPLFAIHLTKVLTNNNPQLLDKQLKVLALSTLLFCLTFGIGLLI